MDETPTPRGDLLFAVAAALTNEEIIKLLDVSFGRLAAAEGKLVVLLGEINRRRMSLPLTPPT